MEEDIIKLYQEALALLRLRNNNRLISGDYHNDDNGNPCFTLLYESKDTGSIKRKNFRHFKNHTDALRYFIKCSQNICSLR